MPFHQIVTECEQFSTSDGIYGSLTGDKSLGLIYTEKKNSEMRAFLVVLALISVGNYNIPPKKVFLHLK